MRYVYTYRDCLLSASSYRTFFFKMGSEISDRKSFFFVCVCMDMLKRKRSGGLQGTSYNGERDRGKREKKEQLPLSCST